MSLIRDFLLLLTIILFLSNKHSYSQNKEDLIVEVFDSDCITVVDFLIGVFDEHVKGKTNMDSIEDAYVHFINTSLNVKNAEDHLDKLDLDQNMLDTLINVFRKSDCFSKIWITEYVIDYISKDTLSVSINISAKSKYTELLSLMASNDKQIAKYLSSIQESGSISPGTIASFDDLSRSFSFKLKEYRLVCAIHFISISFYDDELH